MENQPGLKNFDKNIILFWPPTYMYTLYDYCACGSNVTLMSKESRIETGYIHVHIS